MGKCLSIVLVANGLSFLLASGILLAPANASQPLILNCQIQEGLPIPADRKVTILIDEAKAKVIYGYVATVPRDSNGMIKLADGKLSDDSMAIFVNNQKMIMANNPTGSIVFTKHDGRFAHSFVSVFPLKDGNFFPFGNALLGTCSRSPFN